MTTICTNFGGFWFIFFRLSRQLLTDYELISTSLTLDEEPVKVYQKNCAVELSLVTGTFSLNFALFLNFVDLNNTEYVALWQLI